MPGWSLRWRTRSECGCSALQRDGVGMHIYRRICERSHIGLVGIMEGKAFGWEYMILTIYIVPTLDSSSMSVKYDLIECENPP
jgi:hypothetical protein